MESVLIGRSTPLLHSGYEVAKDGGKDLKLGDPSGTRIFDYGCVSIY